VTTFLDMVVKRYGLVTEDGYCFAAVALARQAGIENYAEHIRAVQQAGLPQHLDGPQGWPMKGRTL
jgi:hypothetical protein